MLRSYADGKPGDAGLLWSDETASVEAAALYNGGLIRSLDWNDTYLSLEPAHPSDSLGAILAAASATDSTGEEALVATALAYELRCRLCDAAALRTKGFDHVNYGLVSATLAAGRLFGLGPEALREAVGLAVNGHVALRQARAGELTEWKEFAFANVSRNAVVAAELADAGVHGPAPVFEGEYGFFEQVAGPFDLDVEAFGGNGGTFKLTETLVEYYPVEHHAQAALGSVLDVLEAESLEWRDVTAVRCRTYEAAVDIVADGPEKWDPRTRETADHSLPYVVARARRRSLRSRTADRGDGPRRGRPRADGPDRDHRGPRVHGDLRRGVPRCPDGRDGDRRLRTVRRVPEGPPREPAVPHRPPHEVRAGRLPDGRIDDVIAWVEGIGAESDLSGLFERCTPS